MDEEDERHHDDYDDYDLYSSQDEEMYNTEEDPEDSDNDLKNYIT